MFPLVTTTILIICKKKQLNINIASIFITLTEINNETHYVGQRERGSLMAIDGDDMKIVLLVTSMRSKLQLLSM
jgi:hypothetical protein